MAQPVAQQAGAAAGDGADAPGRDRILGAALEEFALAGFDGTSTAAIARRAGVTQPLVHYHFASKDALWKAAVEHAVQQARRAFDGVIEELSGLDALGQLKVMVRRFVLFCAAEPHLIRLSSYESMRGGPRLEWLADAGVVSDVGYFRQVYDRAVAEGAIKALPPEHVFPSLAAAAGYLFMAKEGVRISHGVDADDPAVVEAHAEVIVELFFDGLVTRGSDPAPAGGGAGG